MKTIDECKAEAIKSAGYDGWRDMLKSCTLNEIMEYEDEAMEKYHRQNSEVAVLPTDEILESEFRMIISHAFLGEAENISKESFDLAIKGCVEYVKKVAGKT
jgi:hypothetical protein